MDRQTIANEPTHPPAFDASPPGAVLTAAREACAELGFDENHTALVLRVPASADPYEPLTGEAREVLFDVLLLRLGVERLLPRASIEERRAWMFRQGAIGITRNSPLFLMGCGPEYLRQVRDAVWRSVPVGGFRD